MEQIVSGNWIGRLNIIFTKIRSKCDQNGKRRVVFKGRTIIGNRLIVTIGIYIYSDYRNIYIVTNIGIYINTI